ncbi:hypothetical protein [Pseudanabaena yagii]|uniref:Uncharacterized protein n=1 Tax=Pseudanabaena yagii GIHE-NHR1 TaxID=2722753 RepID=A0ABX1LKG7_9CYAN|nr:hypothetical protein [Pseudanabaena yagii]NMF56599.1 hypothetical protein [Pseudanabaena yagii GIHE-NHR1]
MGNTGFAIAEDMQCKDNASASYVITVNWKDALCRNILCIIASFRFHVQQLSLSPGISWSDENVPRIW